MLDKESTLHEWMADPRGKVVLGSFYAQIEAQSRKMFGGGDERYGIETAIGMDIMDMMNDMPLVMCFDVPARRVDNAPGRNGGGFVDASAWYG